MLLYPQLFWAVQLAYLLLSPSVRPKCHKDDILYRAGIEVMSYSGCSAIVCRFFVLNLFLIQYSQDYFTVN